jgi:cytochrome c biogenesis protein CcdA
MEVYEWLSGLGGSGVMPFLVAALLGFRHATDPDHLTAVSTLVLSQERSGARRAGALGLTWGLGHATTLMAFGLPVVVFRRQLPEALLRGAEVAIGLVIIGLAVRLLLRWRRGHFHTHLHTHNGVQHSHPHAHEGQDGHTPSSHTHAHAEGLGRTPLAAYGVGLVHGLGGSAGVGILVVGAASSQSGGVAALVLFAAGTAVSMALVSSTVGYALARGPVARRITSVVPLLALASLAFGVWYALDAASGLPLLLPQ